MHQLRVPGPAIAGLSERARPAGIRGSNHAAYEQIIEAGPGPGKRAVQTLLEQIDPAQMFEVGGADAVEITFSAAGGVADRECEGSDDRIRFTIVPLELRLQTQHDGDSGLRM